MDIYNPLTINCSCGEYYPAPDIVLFWRDIEEMLNLCLLMRKEFMSTLQTALVVGLLPPSGAQAYRLTAHLRAGIGESLIRQEPRITNRFQALVSS